MLKKIIKVTNGLRASKKNILHFFDDDIFLVSYPKSGNTWLRFLLTNYIAGRQTDIIEINKFIPDIHYNPEKIEELHGSPRLIKTHETFKKNYKRVIYIVRDVRDVAVSYYFHLKKFKQIDYNLAFGDYLDLFLEGYFSYGSWGEHVDGWLNGDSDILLIRYEDMLVDTEKVLTDVINFCRLEYDADKVSQSIERCSLKSLREIEHKQFDEVEILHSSDKEIDFFRKGAAGDWHNYFNIQDQEKINLEFSNVMNKVGY